MPVLSSILRDIHTHASIYFCDHLIAPWSMQKKDFDFANFHHVRRGQCQIQCQGLVDLAFAGDVIFITNGADHILSSVDANDKDIALSNSTTLLCGYFKFDQEFQHPLLASLPAFIIIRKEQVTASPGLMHTLKFLTDEYSEKRPGSELLLDKLTEVMLIQLLRCKLDVQSGSNFTHALFDKNISKALSLIHDKPENSWTLLSLSEQVGMSRTAFANRFKKYVGSTMFEYLTKIRMQKACKLLKSTTLPIYVVAEKSGYCAEIAFNKVFKKHLRCTPSSYRKKHR